MFRFFSPPGNSISDDTIRVNNHALIIKIQGMIPVLEAMVHFGASHQQSKKVDLEHAVRETKLKLLET